MDSDSAYWPLSCCRHLGDHENRPDSGSKNRPWN